MALSDNYDLDNLGNSLLSIAHKKISESEVEERTLITSTTKKEIVTKLDIAIENGMIEYLREKNFPVSFDGEETRSSKLSENPQGLIVVDPIDGTYNYFRNFLPYCTIVSIFDFPNPERLGDAKWTGILDHSTGDRVYAKGEKVFLNNKEIRTSGRKTLEGDAEDVEASIFLDYGPGRPTQDYEKFSNIFRRSWIRNISCAGVHLMSVASGASDAYICPVQKPDELVSGIPLIELAGGAVINFEGERIGDKPYDFNKTYEIIAASTKELAHQIKDSLIK